MHVLVHASLFAYVCMQTRLDSSTHACATTHVWRIEKKLHKSVLPLHSVSPEDRTQLTHLFIGDLLC